MPVTWRYDRQVVPTAQCSRQVQQTATAAAAAADSPCLLTMMLTGADAVAYGCRVFHPCCTPGVPFHSLDDQQPGLLACIRSSPSLLASCPGTVDRLHAVHRLDTATSGIVCFATASHIAGLVAKAFRERKVHKYYIALSGRKPHRKQGSVVGDMTRGRSSQRKLLRSNIDPAVTRFQSYSLAEVQAGLRLYLLKPETGRTHQLRVALKSIGAAILGDQLYGDRAAAQLQDRMYLHAAAIRVQLPSGGWFQAVDLPSEGTLFQHPVVRQLIEQLLPAQLADDFGTWFPDHKLLISNTSAPMDAGSTHTSGTQTHHA